MKQLSFGFLVFIFFLISQKPAVAQPMEDAELRKGFDTTNSYAVSLFSNGYAYPKSGDEVLKYISKKGVSGWNDGGVYFRIFFYPQQ
jgi:hypothetical protein